MPACSQPLGCVVAEQALYQPRSCGTERRFLLSKDVERISHEFPQWAGATQSWELSCNSTACRKLGQQIEWAGAHTGESLSTPVNRQSQGECDLGEDACQDHAEAAEKEFWAVVVITNRARAEAINLTCCTRSCARAGTILRGSLARPLAVSHCCPCGSTLNHGRTHFMDDRHLSRRTRRSGCRSELTLFDASSSKSKRP